MPVSEATARKAVQRWGLDGGRVQEAACGCRFWSSVALMLTGGPRQVFTCVNHSPGWNRRDADT